MHFLFLCCVFLIARRVSDLEVMISSFLAGSYEIKIRPQALVHYIYNISCKKWSVRLGLVRVPVDTIAVRNGKESRTSGGTAAS